MKKDAGITQATAHLYIQTTSLCAEIGCDPGSITMNSISWIAPPEPAPLPEHVKDINYLARNPGRWARTLLQLTDVGSDYLPEVFALDPHPCVAKGASKPLVRVGAS